MNFIIKGKARISNTVFLTQKLRVLCMLILANFFLLQVAFAQSYQQKIQTHRSKYKQEFLADEHSPLTRADLKYLKFYEPNPMYLVQAKFERLIDTIGFDMQTHSGVVKKYFVYGKAQFFLGSKQHQLFIYQSETLRTQKDLEDYLFIPFTDKTNSIETFGGGRYLDFRMKDIVEGRIQLDFNKCYNPYCAYADGYSCPIPPSENNLSVSIKAGEKSFSKLNLKTKSH